MVVCAAAIALSGCGTAGDRRQAAAVTERFYAAVEQRDGRTACEQLSPDLRAQLVKDQAGSTCARAVLEVSPHPARGARARVYAMSAEVVLADGDAAFLGHAPEGWRIDAFGCRPRGAGPFDCEQTA
jgi:hypothetical protein